MNSEEVKSKNPVLLRERDFWLPEFCSNQRHIRSEISSHCSACGTSLCSYFFLRRHRLFLPPAAAVSAPVNSLRLCIQNAVSIKMKNQKRNHPNGWFLFCHSCPKKNWVKTEDFLHFFLNIDLILLIIPNF